MADEKFKYGVFEQGSINPDRLTDEIRDALGEKCVSVDTGVLLKDRKGAHIIVKMKDDVSEAERLVVEQTIQQHDPANLSRDQQRTKDSTEAYARLMSADFEAIRRLKGDAQTAAILDLLEDYQRLMRVQRG